MRVNPALAAAIGLNESIVLLQLDYLIGISTSEHHDGKQWTYQQWKGGFDQMFPWMVEKTLRRCIATLKDRGLVETSRHRTNWYTVNRDKLAELTGQNVLSNEADKGQIVPGPEDKMSSDADEKGQNVSSEKDKMSSDKRTNCLFPIHTEISTKTSHQEGEGADAPSALPAKAKRAKTETTKPELLAKDGRPQSVAARELRNAVKAEHPGLTKGQIFQLNDASVLVLEHDVEDILGCWRAIKAKHGGDYKPVSWVGMSIRSWIKAGRPAVEPAKYGAPNAERTNGILEASGLATGRNKYVEDEEMEAAFRERSRRQQRQVPA